MAKRIPEPTKRPRERTFLVGVELRDQEQLLSIEDSLSELGMLASTAGLNVIGQTVQKLNVPNPKTFIGSGKVDEVKSLAELPPLPVMRAQLLGVLSAPAGKLVRTLAEPARGLASVLQAFADAEGDAAPAAA